MPTPHDIIQDWEHGVISFFIISAAVVVFYAFLVVIDQHHRMKPPKRKIFVAGCAFICIVALWTVLALASHFVNFMTAVTGHLNQQIEDMRTAAISRENRGLIAGVLVATPAVSTNGVLTTNSTITLQSISSSPENRTVEPGSGLIFVLRVVNSGAPTTAWDFRAYIILPGPDEQKMDASIPSILIPTADTLPSIPTVAGLFQPDAKNFLLNGLAFTPLATGAAQNYWLVVHVNGLHDIPTGTKYVITFHDVYGRTVKVEHTWVPNQ